MTLTAGSRLGPYEVLSLIGAGGMGEVYRVRDTRLGRDVAAKILPETFTHDNERVARFRREAQLLASLNHPNIATIHGLEEADGHQFLVMELVEGETLDKRIARGPVAIDDALAIARQIADALEAAHEKGIIHRDLKPANVALTANDHVKVLDFGLAKLADSETVRSDDAFASPTITSPPAITGLGVILGTAAYMSPEQAKGRVADKRVDVWAFGCVLYEMLTGKRAFGGGDVSDTLVAVLRDDPDLNVLPAGTPPAVRLALRTCLQKDPKKRVRDVATVRLVLEGTFDASVPASVPVLRATPLLPWALVVLFAGAAIGLTLSRPDRPISPVSRFVITDSAEQMLGVTTAQPVVAISADGSRIVYRVARAPGPAGGELYIRRLDRGEPTRLAAADSANGPFFSPTGEWIAYHDGRENALKRVPIDGGRAVTICALDGGLRGGAWLADDTIIFATTTSKGLLRVPVTGGKPERLTTVDKAGEFDHLWPEPVPDAQSVLFTKWSGSLNRSRVSVLSLASGTVIDLVSGSSARFVPPGHLVFASRDGIYGIGFDIRQMRTVGREVLVLEGVSVSATAGIAHFSAAHDGSLAYLSGGSGLSSRTLVWVDRTGREEPIDVPPRAYTYARLSPDGSRVALDARDDQNDIWIWDLARKTLQRLTTDPDFNRSPVWSPDSTRVAFTAVHDGVESIHWQLADGSNRAERVSVGEVPQVPESFTPDGSWLLISTPLNVPFDIGAIRMDASREVETLIATPANETHAEVSPDGRWLAYTSSESGQNEVYVRPFPNVHASRRQVSTGGGSRPVWSRNGPELFYYGAGVIMAVPVSLGNEITLGVPAVAVKGSYADAINAGRHYDVARDGRFLLLKDVAQPDSKPSSSPKVHLVLNWREELKRLVPTQ